MAMLSKLVIELDEMVTAEDDQIVGNWIKITASNSEERWSARVYLGDGEFLIEPTGIDLPSDEQLVSLAAEYERTLLRLAVT